MPTTGNGDSWQFIWNTETKCQENEESSSLFLSKILGWNNQYLELNDDL